MTLYLFSKKLSECSIHGHLLPLRIYESMRMHDFSVFTSVELCAYVDDFVKKKSARKGLERHGSMLHLHFALP